MSAEGFGSERFKDLGGKDDWGWGHSANTQGGGLFDQSKNFNPFGGGGDKAAPNEVSGLKWGSSDVAAGAPWGSAAANPAQSPQSLNWGTSTPAASHAPPRQEKEEEEEEDGDYDEGDYDEGDYDEGDYDEEASGAEGLAGVKICSPDKAEKTTPGPFASPPSTSGGLFGFGGTGGAFGASSTGSAFGGDAQATFSFADAAKSPGFGAATSAFGASPAVSAFAPEASAFGSPSAGSAFGSATASATSAFGASPAPATSSFGAPPAPATSAFGASPAPATSAFGAPPAAATSAFAPSATGSAFGTAGQSPGGGDSSFSFASAATGSAFGAGGEKSFSFAFAPPAEVQSAFAPAPAESAFEPSAPSSSSFASAAASGFGAPKPAAPDTVVADKGGLLYKPDFWQLERDAPVLNLNKGYLFKGRDLTDLEAKLTNWLQQTQVTPAFLAERKAAYEAYAAKFIAAKTVPDRIFVKDADRTFKAPKNIQLLIRMLSFMQDEFGGYHQGLSLIAGFFLLVASPEQTIALLCKFNAEERYVPGVWMSEAIKSATDSFVYWDIIKARYPAVLAHLKKSYVSPELYYQKYCCALCVHVLPYEALYVYFDRFVERGFKQIFHFALNVVKHMQASLLHGEANSLLAILRLDLADSSVDCVKALEIVLDEDTDWGLDVIDYKTIRKQAYDVNLKERMERANSAHAELDSDDEIVFSDEESEGEETEEEEEGEEEEKEEEAIPELPPLETVPAVEPEAVSFGSLSLGADTPAEPSGGFSFAGAGSGAGGAFAAPATNAFGGGEASGFSFAAPAPAAGGFGGSTAAAPAAAPAAGAFGAAAAGSAFGTSASTASPAAAPAASGFSFGAPAANAFAPAPAANAFAPAASNAFGGPPDSSPFAPAPSAFGAPAAVAAPAAASTPATAISFPPPAAAPSSAFSFTPSATSSFGQDTPSTAAPDPADLQALLPNPRHYMRHLQKDLARFTQIYEDSHAEADVSALLPGQDGPELRQAVQEQLSQLQAAVDPRAFDDAAFSAARSQLMKAVKDLCQHAAGGSAKKVIPAYAKLVRFWMRVRAHLQGQWSALTWELPASQVAAIRAMFKAAAPPFSPTEYNRLRYKVLVSLPPAVAGKDPRDDVPRVLVDLSEKLSQGIFEVDEE